MEDKLNIDVDAIVNGDNLDDEQKVKPDSIKIPKGFSEKELDNRIVEREEKSDSENSENEIMENSNTKLVTLLDTDENRMKEVQMNYITQTPLNYPWMDRPLKAIPKRDLKNFLREYDEMFDIEKIVKMNKD